MKRVKQTIFANGCFWCTEAVFQRLEGVLSVRPGYTGGHIKNPAYREVCSGRTGHAEAIAIEYDPEAITYQTLLEVFFATHDPTTLNRQGNDVGTQYRSGIFYSDETEREEAEAFIQLLTEGRVFRDPIVTEVTPLDEFYEAEEVHHNYYNDNEDQPYCRFVVAPKIEKIKEFYSDKLKK
ncbi:peptide-methionine (S)-S-oxide reductase MsrA [Aureitalea marina]|uniref:Peptide methionine sulfoxide reductase MsrA n=1 Tax=Aureitalea marina TaxID=930804 RepID=A0A2S7KPD4_9FLAO|nr:peptide-methionine (S)-S-oxide reductase MsrA [Aureitalea marina]PQB04485.1 peptide-methionine (S)-S-oxide reductase [Aureitalea marina]